MGAGDEENLRLMHADGSQKGVEGDRFFGRGECDDMIKGKS